MTLGIGFSRNPCCYSFITVYAGSPHDLNKQSVIRDCRNHRALSQRNPKKRLQVSIRDLPQVERPTKPHPNSALPQAVLAPKIPLCRRQWPITSQLKRAVTIRTFAIFVVLFRSKRTSGKLTRKLFCISNPYRKTPLGLFRKAAGIRQT